MLHHSIEALRMTGIMAWQILWALSLGFLLSSIVEAVVSKAQLSKLLPDSSPKHHPQGHRPRRGLLLLLLRRHRPRPHPLPQGGRLHRRHGLPVRLHQSRRRTQRSPLRPARLAVHGSRVRRRSHHDRPTRRPPPRHPPPAHHRSRPRPCQPRPRRTHGGPRRHGHEPPRRHLLAKNNLPPRHHRHQPLLLDGLVLARPRRRPRPLHRRRPRRLRPQQLLAGLLPRRPSCPHPHLGPAHRPARRRPLLRLLGRQRPPRRCPLERRHQLRRSHQLPLRRPPHPPHPQHLPQVLRPQRRLHPRRHLLPRHGRRRPHRRSPLLRPASHPRPPSACDHERRHHLELHLRPQSRLPRPQRAPSPPLPPHRRPRHVARDGQRPRQPQRRPPLLLPRRTRTNCPKPPLTPAATPIQNPHRPQLTAAIEPGAPFMQSLSSMGGHRRSRPPSLDPPQTHAAIPWSHAPLRRHHQSRQAPRLRPRRRVLALHPHRTPPQHRRHPRPARGRAHLRGSTPAPRPSTTPSAHPTSSSSPTTPASRSPPSTAPPEYAAPASPPTWPTPPQPTRPTSATTPPSSPPSPTSPNPAARPVTAALSPSPAMANSSTPPTARSRASSSPPRAALAASATTPSSSFPHLNRTMSELPPADRLALNHRGRAITSCAQLAHNSATRNLAT